LFGDMGDTFRHVQRRSEPALSKAPSGDFAATSPRRPAPAAQGKKQKSPGREARAHCQRYRSRRGNA